MILLLVIIGVDYDEVYFVRNIFWLVLFREIGNHGNGNGNWQPYVVQITQLPIGKIKSKWWNQRKTKPNDDFANWLFFLVTIVIEIEFKNKFLVMFYCFFAALVLLQVDVGEQLTNTQISEKLLFTINIWTLHVNILWFYAIIHINLFPALFSIPLRQQIKQNERGALFTFRSCKFVCVENCFCTFFVCISKNLFSRNFREWFALVLLANWISAVLRITQYWIHSTFLFTFW